MNQTFSGQVTTWPEKASVEEKIMMDDQKLAWTALRVLSSLLFWERETVRRNK